jgi:site-specific DNA recombinase
MRLRRIEPIEAKGKKQRVCAYARVSTDSIEQGESFENQVITYERLIKSNPEYEFIGVYADQGISGTSENRPEFQRMMEDCRNGKIDLIITKSISRFARNTTIVLNYTRELKQLGIGVYFEENNINTLSAEGELMMTVLASFAQEESRSISENNKWSIGKRFERGEGMINTTRFMGYDKDKTGDLVINKAEAKIVRRIFEMYLSGEGCHRIAKILNDEGIKTITGSKWHSSTIKGMLINEKYKGDFHIQKYYTPEGKRNHTVKNNGEVKSFYVSENHPAIVSEEEWQQVQELMQYHKEQRNIQSGNKYQNRYPMSGMLICPHCGKSLRRRYVYNRKVEWICSTYIQKGKEACNGIRVRDELLTGLSFTEPMVVEEVFENGEKHYGYTSKAAYDNGERAADRIEEERSSVLPRINRSRRTVIEL